MKQAPIRHSFQHRLEYCALRAAEGLASLLGIRRSARLWGWLWQCFAPLARQHRQAHANLTLAFPDWSADQRARTVSAMWGNLGMIFGEALAFEALSGPQTRIDVPDLALLREAAESGRGLVLVSLHSGNFEALGVPLMRAGIQVAGMYQAIQNPLVESHSLKARRKLYLAGLFAKGADSLRKVMGIVKAGGTVAILSDQRTIGGPNVPFFGRPAPSNPFPAILVHRYGTRLIAARCRRKGPADFIIDLKELTPSDLENRDEAVIETTALIQAQFEAWIREEPGQWMWGHRRHSREKA